MNAFTFQVSYINCFHRPVSTNGQTRNRLLCDESRKTSRLAVCLSVADPSDAHTVPPSLKETFTSMALNDKSGSEANLAKRTILSSGFSPFPHGKQARVWYLAQVHRIPCTYGRRALSLSIPIPTIVPLSFYFYLYLYRGECPYAL